MSSLVLLDTGPLGMFTNPSANAKNKECRRRVEELLAAGSKVFAPAIAVYETRRKLVHLQLTQPATKRLTRFDAGLALLDPLPITDEVMRRASEIWGESRANGINTDDPKTLGGDVILVAQARVLEADTGGNVEIATVDRADLKRLFPNIRLWDDLKK